MAKPDTDTFSKMIIEIRLSAGPDVWAAPIGVTSKSLTINASTSSTTVPDKDDPEAVGWDESGVDALSWQIQTEGVQAREDQAMWEQWIDSAAPKVVRIRTPGFGYRQGGALLTSLGQATALKSDANLVKRAVTLQSTGPAPWVAGDPA
jgi:hypothetical protein